MFRHIAIKNAEFLRNVRIDLKERGDKAELLLILSIGAGCFCSNP